MRASYIRGTTPEFIDRFMVVKEIVTGKNFDLVAMINHYLVYVLGKPKKAYEGKSGKYFV